MTRLLALDLRDEQGIVLARQRSRQVAELLGFDRQDQVRLATAVSEVARNAVQHGGGGRAEFAADGQTLAVTVTDRGPGIADVAAVLDGGTAPPTGTGTGLVAARRLVDELTVQCPPGGGTVVRLGKAIPRRGAPAAHDFARLSAELSRPSPGATTELLLQNQELLRTLGELRERDARLAEMSRELEETNRGVVALYAELEEKADSLRRVSDLKTRFLSNASHEFRTPLNSIISLSQLLLARADGPLTEEQEKQVTFIRRAAAGLSELVNDLLDLAKVEAGKVVVRPEEFSAADLFATLRGLMRPLLTSDAVALVFEDVADLGTLRTDEGKVSQILRNFLSNALKFTERGEIRVGGRPGEAGTVVFAVSDTGIGIAPENQARIFEEFGQVESAVQRRVRGTGLGLSLSRRLAEVLGGRVWLRSEPGAGSTFYLSVPSEYRGPAEPRRAAPGAGAGLPLLVIDDDEIARYLLRGLLGDGRFDLREAADGHEGLRRAREERPRAIFLDLVMPDLSGFDVLERLKGDPVTRDIPVIVYTSRTLDAGERDWLAARAVEILSKGTGESREAAARAVHDALSKAGVGSGA
jgi:signal transduction histidine kinase/CheY-like chemotaxis protein